MRRLRSSRGLGDRRDVTASRRACVMAACCSSAAGAGLGVLRSSRGTTTTSPGAPSRLLLVIWLAVSPPSRDSDRGHILDDPDYDSVLFAISASSRAGLRVRWRRRHRPRPALRRRLLGSLGDFGARADGRLRARPAGGVIFRRVPASARALRRRRLSRRRSRRGDRERVLLALQLVFVVWSLVFLVIGVRTCTAGTGRDRSSPCSAPSRS